MEFKGRIIAALPPRSGVSQKGSQWQCNEYVIEQTEGQYPRKMCFEVFGDKIQEFNLQSGNEYVISFDIDARQWKDRWFNSIRAWKAVPVQATQSTAPQAQATVFQDPFAAAVTTTPTEQTPVPAAKEETAKPAEEESDLPF